MKKYILLLFIFPGVKLFAQIPEDAIRYSWFPQNGTARNMAIGGVMGSLGGDLTAAYVNPAGLGFYKTQEFVLTPGFLFNKTKADFRETTTTENKNAFSFGPSGWIFGFTNNRHSRQSNAIAIAISQTANFNNIIHYRGLNNYTSFSEQFAEEFAKSGYNIDDVLNTNSIFPYTAAPALYTYLIDTVRLGGFLQAKAAPEYILDAGDALEQEMTKKTSGAIYELALSFAQNNNDKWFIGGTLGIPFIHYKSNTTFTENDTSSNVFNKFRSFSYNDQFTTTGAGGNLKLGVIYRPQDYLRLGLAVHTPSFMVLADKRTVTLDTHLESDSGTAELYSVSSTTFTNDQPGESKYFQTSAWRAILSASYVFREVEDVRKQRAFISADIEYVNHKGSRFNSNNEVPTEDEKAYYKSLNGVVKNEFKGAFNFKVGGELKFNTIMGRLGFAYYGNPYKEKILKVNRMLLSTGLGYRNKGFFVDLTYVHHITKDIDFPYRLEDRANTYAAIKEQQGNVVGTVGFKF